MGSLSDRYRRRMAVVGIPPDESYAKELDAVSEEGSAAAGKVSFNVTASVRYPEAEPAEDAGLAKLAAETEETRALLCGMVDALYEGLVFSLGNGHYRIRKVEGVGVEVTNTNTRRTYNVDVREGF